MGVLLVGAPQNFAFVWPGGTQQPFEIQAGHYVLKLAVPVDITHLRVKRLQTG